MQKTTTAAGRALVKATAANGITAKELAILAGVCTATISDWRRKGVPAPRVRDIANLLNVRADYIVNAGRIQPQGFARHQARTPEPLNHRATTHPATIMLGDVKYIRADAIQALLD